MTKIIKLNDGSYLAIDTEFDNIDDYIMNVLTQDYDGENYFCPGIDNRGKPVWYPIDGAEFIDCEVIEKADNVIPEPYNDVQTKTLYLEHIDGRWNILNDDNEVLGAWDDIAFSQSKIDGILKKVEEEYSARVILEFKLEDMTLDELKERLNKNWQSLQALEERERELFDECLDGLQTLICKECNDIKEVKYALKQSSSKHRGYIHNYHLEKRRLIAREKPLILEGKALIDKLFSMIEGG